MTRGCDINGYGMVSCEGRTWYVHRLMYEFSNGAIREDQIGLIVLHQCDVPACCNPAHLTLGTASRNSREAADRCRGTYGVRRADGEGRYRKVGTVFYEYCGEVKSLREWAEQFGVNISTLDQRFQKKGSQKKSSRCRHR